MVLIKIRAFFLVAILLFITGCGGLTSTTLPTVDLLVLTNSMSISRGSEGNMLLDVSGTGASEFTLYITFDSLESYPNNVILNLAQPNKLFDCNEGRHSLLCSYKGSKKTFSFSQLAVQFDVPEEHSIGTWDVKVYAITANGTNAWLRDTAEEYAVIPLTISN